MTITLKDGWRVAQTWPMQLKRDQTAGDVLLNGQEYEPAGPASLSVNLELAYDPLRERDNRLVKNLLDAIHDLVAAAQRTSTGKE